MVGSTSPEHHLPTMNPCHPDGILILMQVSRHVLGSKYQPSGISIA
jgi:hypothetical protein